MPTFGSLSPSRSNRHTALALCIILMTAGAWCALWFLDGPSQGFSHHHHHHAVTNVGPAVLAPLLFVGGWALMSVAMMLPTSLPVLLVFSAIARQRSDRVLLLVLVITGYLLVWTLFGGVVYFGNLALQSFAGANTWLVDHSWASAPILLLIAGAFQFTPLKYRCLDKCRSPLSFVLGHWQGRHERLQAFRLGVDHGIFCVGCCWALMLLMFVVGIGSLLWMMILAVVMGIEKNASWGRRLSAPLGIVLLLTAVALLVLA
jgi:predicted metal-binding membrane protein